MYTADQKFSNILVFITYGELLLPRISEMGGGEVETEALKTITTSNFCHSWTKIHQFIGSIGSGVMFCVSIWLSFDIFDRQCMPFPVNRVASIATIASLRAVFLSWFSWCVSVSAYQHMKYCVCIVSVENA